MAAASKVHQGSGRALAVWALVFATGWFVMLTDQWAPAENLLR